MSLPGKVFLSIPFGHVGSPWGRLRCWRLSMLMAIRSELGRVISPLIKPPHNYLKKRTKGMRGKSGKSESL